MSRLTPCAAVLLWASAIACRSWGPIPPLAPLPGGCDPITGATVMLTVNTDADVDRPCIGIHKQRTEVTWTGTAGVKKLLIAFKANASPLPSDPTCTGSVCKVKRSALDKEGDFFYSVVVVRQDGSVKSYDPRLIIQP